MDIRFDEAKRRFTGYGENGAEIGHIDYEPENGAFAATHTYVHPQYEGHGYAAQLLDALAAHAEKQGVKIIPRCKYVAAVFRKFPEKYAAVIAEAPLETEGGGE